MVVTAAVTLETSSSATELSELAWTLRNVEIAQVSVTKARPRGAYHMMTAQNPVFIISGRARGDRPAEASLCAAASGGEGRPPSPAHSSRPLWTGS